MITRNLDIRTADGLCDASFSYPDEHGIYPAVLLFMDGFGPRPYLRQMAETLAGLDCAVLLPNLFYRTRKAPVLDAHFPLKPEDMPAAIQQIMPYFKSFSHEAAMRDTDSFVAFLDAQARVRKGPMGLTGYCLGGGIALRAAARHPGRFAAAASFHGGNLATEAPDSPHTVLPQVRAELYFAHADQDQSMPPEQMERLKRALESVSAPHETEVYAGASHGFTMADLPAGNEEALWRHWMKLSMLFQRALGTHAWSGA